MATNGENNPPSGSIAAPVVETVASQGDRGVSNGGATQAGMLCNSAATASLSRTSANRIQVKYIIKTQCHGL